MYWRPNLFVRVSERYRNLNFWLVDRRRPRYCPCCWLQLDTWTSVVIARRCIEFPLHRNAATTSEQLLSKVSRCVCGEAKLRASKALCCCNSVAPMLARRQQCWISVRGSVRGGRPAIPNLLLRATRAPFFLACEERRPHFSKYKKKYASRAKFE